MHAYKPELKGVHRAGETGTYPLHTHTPFKSDSFERGTGCELHCVPFIHKKAD